MRHNKLSSILSLSPWERAGVRGFPRQRNSGTALPATMAKSASRLTIQPAARPAPAEIRTQADEPAEPSELGLEDFVEPDDQGLSLAELSQAYAVLLKRGADPYPQPDAADTSEGESQDPIDPADDSPAPTPDPPHEKHSGEPRQVIRGEDESTCEVTPKRILEAILFVGHPANEPLGSERIAGLMRGVQPREIDDLVEELNAEYAEEGAPYTITSVGYGYQLALRTEFASLREAFYGRVREAKLSQTAIDVLAVVAYQQPITQEKIDQLRGKPSGALLSQLVRRDLLAIERSADKKVKPLYRTTERFLDLFGLDNLTELPRSHDL
jgi:segregation and condensation protein B